MKKKTWIIHAVAVFAALFGLYFLELLLSPKYMDQSRDGALIGEYYDQKEKHDVIFIGDCEIYENFSPVTLWEEYGISSYLI